MPDRRPTGAAVTVQRQVRHVRRRHNLHQLQRTLYLLLAALAAAAAALVACALWADASTFTVASWVIAALLAVATVTLLAGLRRRWLAPADAVAWIERRSQLAGRLRTLVELADRRSDDAPALFLPLLAEENLRRLGLWAPSRLVPRRVPRAEVATAAVAAGVLLIALLLGWTLRPRVTAGLVGDHPLAAARTATPAGEVPEAIALAQAESPSADPAPRPDRESAAPGNQAPPAMTRLPEELQERIRRTIWGKGSRALEDPIAGARWTETSDGNGSAENAGEWELADLSSKGASPESASGARTGAADTSEHGSDENDAPAPANADGTRGGGSAGAGTGADPNLFGRPGDDTPRGNASFALAIAARVRTRHGKAGDLAGEPPPPLAPDARPALAARQRHPAAAHKMPVPSAYEQIVRQVFAHRAPDDGGRP